MNIQGLNSLSATRSLGARLDITSNAQANPGRPTALHAAGPARPIGTIPNVLSDDENRAIAAMFQSAPPHTYTMNGATRPVPVKPGLRIDVQA